MDLNTLIDTAVPTPFGWVLTTQPSFDLAAMASFRSQLLSLSRNFGKIAPVADATVEAQVEVPVLIKA
jgi:hypothetical protein